MNRVDEGAKRWCVRWISEHLIRADGLFKKEGYNSCKCNSVSDRYNYFFENLEETGNEEIRISEDLPGSRSMH